MKRLPTNIVGAYADYAGISMAEASKYLAKCDEIYELPSGALTRCGNVIHIVARQRGLSGRKLVADVRTAVARFHQVESTLTCPIRHENRRAIKFAEFFGFKPYHVTETHQWLYRHSGDAI